MVLMENVEREKKIEKENVERIDSFLVMHDQHNVLLVQNRHVHKLFASFYPNEEKCLYLLNHVSISFGNKYSTFT